MVVSLKLRSRSCGCWSILSNCFAVASMTRVAASSGMFVQSAEFVDPHTTENGNLDWVQHMAPNRGAGFVLANGSMSCDRPGEGVIRGTLIAA